MEAIKVQINGKEETIHCRQADNFPPIHLHLMEPGETPEDLRGGRLTEAQYQRIKVWERVCGLSEMNTDKCLTCLDCMLQTGVHKHTKEPELKPITHNPQQGLYRRGRG